MEEVPQNSKKLSHSAHASGINEWMNECVVLNIVTVSKVKGGETFL
jgi:hypothetical protein